MEVVDLAQTITAEDKTVCKHPNAHLARIKDILPVVCWGGITVRHEHLREGCPVDDWAPASPVEILDKVGVVIVLGRLGLSHHHTNESPLLRGIGRVSIAGGKGIGDNR